MIFASKVVAITGAVGGIGQSLCRFFGKEGATIAAIDQSPDIAGFANELTSSGIKVSHAVADIGDRDAIAAAFEKLATDLGTIDILVNNAGFSSHPTFSSTTPESWQYEMNANLNGYYYCAHAVLNGMRAKRSGCIVAIGSVNALGALGDPAYSAAKAGLVSLTKSLALEYGRYNIRSNIVLPGTVRTPLWERRAAKDPTVLETLRKWYPLGRIVDPDDVARAVAFQCSRDGRCRSGRQGCRHSDADLT